MLCSVAQRVQCSSKGAVELAGCSVVQKKDALKLRRGCSIAQDTAAYSSGVCSVAQGCSVAKWSPAYSIVYQTYQIRDILVKIHLFTPYCLSSDQGYFHK